MREYYLPDLVLHPVGMLSILREDLNREGKERIENTL
jgi:hypothetical protein